MSATRTTSKPSTAAHNLTEVWEVGVSAVNAVVEVNRQVSEKKSVYVLSRAMNAGRLYRRSTNPRQRTPDAFFKQLDEEFHFTLDAAASDRNAKCSRYFTVKDDGLGKDWGTERVWLNPPYGHGPGIGEWIRKAYEAATNGALVVCLVPSSTDRPWWHDWALKADEIRFVLGRIQFLNEDGTAGQQSMVPSVVLVFRPSDKAERVSLL